MRARSKAEQISDWIAWTAGSGPVLVLHVVWCGVWVTVNVGVIRGVRPFDPFPFPFLTMTVLLEAIFLALFVLASQNRLARQADKHSHLDLQIHLLGEREMTAVLQLLRTLPASERRDQRDVRTVARPHEETELRRLTTRMEELAEPMMPGDSTGIAAAPDPEEGRCLAGFAKASRTRGLAFASRYLCAQDGIPLVDRARAPHVEGSRR